jgi:hypothetical protein
VWAAGDSIPNEVIFLIDMSIMALEVIKFHLFFNSVFIYFLSSFSHIFVALGGLVLSVLATGPKVRGFKPGRGRWIVRVIKSVARLPSEGK